MAGIIMWTVLFGMLSLRRSGTSGSSADGSVDQSSRPQAQSVEWEGAPMLRKGIDSASDGAPVGEDSAAEKRGIMPTRTQTGLRVTHRDMRPPSAYKGAKVETALPGGTDTDKKSLTGTAEKARPFETASPPAARSGDAETGKANPVTQA